MPELEEVCCGICQQSIFSSSTQSRRMWCWELWPRDHKRTNVKTKANALKKAEGGDEKDESHRRHQGVTELTTLEHSPSRNLLCEIISPFSFKLSVAM